MNKRHPRLDICWNTWRKQHLGLDTRHRSDRWWPLVRPVKAVRPQILVLTVCPTKPYGSIGISSRWSQKMFYQGKFKSLHHVSRSGKMKIWIPLERRTRVESKELEGESEEGPWEILLLPILSLSLGWIFTTTWVLREVEEGRGDGLHGLERVNAGE
jgi:hypothetical protein